jgi:hypothetical protein
MKQSVNAKVLEVLLEAEKQVKSLHDGFLFGFDQEDDQLAVLIDDVVEIVSPMATQHYLTALEHIQLARRHMTMTRLTFKQAIKEDKT